MNTPRNPMTPIRSLALAGLLPLAAQAHYATDQCTREPGQSPVTTPVTLNIGAAAAVGEPVGPWFTQTVTWTCKRVVIGGPDFPNRTDDRFKVYSRFKPAHTLEDTGKTVQADGKTYKVYRQTAADAQNGHRIGVILRVTQAIDGDPETVDAVNTPVADIQKRYFVHSPHRAVGAISTFRLKLQARFVKLENTTSVAGASIKVLEVGALGTKDKSLAGVDSDWLARTPAYYHYLQTTVASLAAACTTPNVKVDLVQTSVSKLLTQGHGENAPFNVRFENCPQNMHSIVYKFTPATGTHVDGAGVLSLMTPDSSATGVGVQVLNEDGTTPLAFNTVTPLQAYAQNPTLTNYQLPLNARIVRTTGTLNAGDVKAGMKVVATYK